MLKATTSEWEDTINTNTEMTSPTDTSSAASSQSDLSEKDIMGNAAETSTGQGIQHVSGSCALLSLGWSLSCWMCVPFLGCDCLLSSMVDCQPRYQIFYSLPVEKDLSTAQLVLWYWYVRCTSVCSLTVKAYLIRVFCLAWIEHYTFIGACFSAFFLVLYSIGLQWVCIPQDINYSRWFIYSALPCLTSEEVCLGSVGLVYCVKGNSLGLQGIVVYPFHLVYWFELWFCTANSFFVSFTGQASSVMNNLASNTDRGKFNWWLILNLWLSQCYSPWWPWQLVLLLFHCNCNCN